MLSHRLESVPDLCDHLINSLIERRNEDGGWGHGPARPSEINSGCTDPLPTAIAILGLSKSGELSAVDVSDHIRTGTEYLCRWWQTRSHELHVRPGTWAISLLAVAKAQAHVCEPSEITKNTTRLARLVDQIGIFNTERIDNAARYLDTPYFLLSSAWAIASFAESAPLETLFEQINLLHFLKGLIRSDGSAGLLPNDTQSHIYSSFNIYLAFRTFINVHGKSILMEKLLAQGKEARKIMTNRNNSHARVFIGSSVEGLDIARKIRSGFEHDPFDVVIWEDGIFVPSASGIESLEKAAGDFDFAILILTPDDLTQSRDAVLPSIRDNLLFEAGLFMGSMGRGRVFLVRPRMGLKWPTDFLGITPVDYDAGRFLRDPRAAVSSVADKIRDIIKVKGPR